MITINSQLDMTPGAIPVVIHRSQYDSDFSIVFTLFSRTGDFTIASGTTARVRGTKKTGTGYSSDAMLSISAKTVTVYGDQQMTVAAGDNIFEIVLLSGAKELCSANFVLAVERAAMDKDTITDATVVPELEHLDEYTRQAADQAARRASVYAESWAVGGTGTRVNEDTNNAKYWAEQAQGAVSGVASFNGRTGVVVPATGDYKSEMIRRGNSTTTVEDTLTSLGNTATDLRSRMYTQEGYTSDLRTRMSTAESDIDALDSNKVDKTTPLLNFDDTATDPLTDDGALANALRTLGILSSVIPSGGDALYLKKTLTQLAQLVTPVRAEFTPTSGTADTSAGKCYYEVIGKIVHVHVALTGLTVNTQLTLYTLPAEVRPRHRMTTIGICGHITYRSYITLKTSGELAVYSQEDNTMADMFYTL